MIFFVILAEMLAEILSDILAKILGEIFSEIQANVSSKILSNILGYSGCDFSRDLTWKFGVDSNGLLISFITCQEQVSVLPPWYGVHTLSRSVNYKSLHSFSSASWMNNEQRRWSAAIFFEG